MTMSKATRRKLFALGVVLFAVLGVAGLYQVREASKERALQRDRVEGMAAYEAQDYAKAIPHLSRYVGAHRDDAEALLAFADARRLVPAEDGSMGHLKHALATTRLALEHEPGSLKGRTMLMQLVAQQMGATTEADRAAQEVLALDPSNAEAFQIRLLFAQTKGDDKARVEIAKQMADQLPNDFSAQMTALNTVTNAGMPEADVEAFVKAHTGGLNGTMGAELLSALYAVHRYAAATSESERAALGKQVADHLGAATALPPVQADEVRVLFDVLDANPSILPDISPDDLLRGYLKDSKLGVQLVDFAAQRAWQRGDEPLLASIAEMPGSLAELPDDALGWLALGIPQRTDLAEELARRTSEASRQWSVVLRAAGMVRDGRFAEAREALREASASGQFGTRQVAQYLEARCLYGLGESSLADQTAEALARNGGWVRARALLRDRALLNGDYERAFMLTQRDRLPQTLPLLLEIAVSLDEEGYSWPPGAPDGRVMVETLLETNPDNPDLMSLRARAELARGNRDAAIELADKLLALEQPNLSPLVVKLADRLETVDTERSRALRARYAPATTSLTQRLAGELLTGSIAATDALEQIDAALGTAAPEQRRELRLLRTGVLEQLGAPDLADELAKLSADYPADAEIQSAALRSDVIWQRAELVRPIIERLRKLTGDDGLAWRVFLARLTLAEDESEEAAARVIVDLSSVLRLAPDDVQALALSAEAAARVNDLDRAASYATRASDAAPMRLGLAIRAVNALDRAGMTDEAVSRARTLSEVPPATIGERVARASVLSRLGLTEPALSDWRSLAEASDPQARAAAAQALASMGATDDASKAIEGLAELDGATVGSRVSAADALMLLGRRAEAVDLLRTAPEFDAAGEDRDAAIANLLARHAEDDEALDALTTFVRDSRSAQAWAAAIRRHMGMDMIDEARSLLEEALGRVDDPAALVSFQRALDPNAAADEKSFLAIAQATISSQEAPWKAELLSKLDAAIRGETALTAFAGQMREFVASNRNTEMGWFLLVWTQVTVEDWEDARRSVREMLRTFPRSAQVGDFAVQTYMRMLTNAPAAMTPALLNEAVPVAQDAEARLPQPTLESGRATASLAMAANLPREAWAAIGRWRSQLATPQDVVLYTRAALANGQIGPAADAWWQGPLTEPERTYDAIRMAGLIPDASSRSQWLSQAGTRLAPGDETGRFALANGWYELAVSQGSAEALNKALAAASGPEAQDPKVEASLSLLRASCLAQLGRTEEAIGAYRTVLRLEPDNAAACNNLAYILVDRDGQTDEALSLSRHAVEVARGSGASPEALASYLDTLGTVLLRKGQAADARAAFQEALDAQPGYDFALVGIAEACAELGDAERALASLRELGASPPEHLRDRVAKVRERLGE